MNSSNSISSFSGSSGGSSNNSNMTITRREPFQLQEVESKKFGDVEKEKEIERRLRELGLWENKRHLERRLADMLETRIDQNDGLTKTLKKVRRKREGSSSVEEIRNIINPKVIRDIYGQQVAYHVDVLMGCFTKDVVYDVSDNLVTVAGITPDPLNKLSKEIQLELPKSVELSRLVVSYTAGVFKIRVPFQQPPPPSRSQSTQTPPPTKFLSVSPLYSLQQRLSSSSAPPDETVTTSGNYDSENLCSGNYCSNKSCSGEYSSDKPCLNNYCSGSKSYSGNFYSGNLCSGNSCSASSSPVASSDGDDLDVRSELSLSSPIPLTAETFDLNILLNSLDESPI